MSGTGRCQSGVFLLGIDGHAYTHIYTFPAHIVADAEANKNKENIHLHVGSGKMAAAPVQPHGDGATATAENKGDAPVAGCRRWLVHPDLCQSAIEADLILNGNVGAFFYHQSTVFGDRNGPRPGMDIFCVWDQDSRRYFDFLPSIERPHYRLQDTKEHTDMDADKYNDAPKSHAVITQWPQSFRKLAHFQHSQPSPHDADIGQTPPWVRYYLKPPPDPEYE